MKARITSKEQIYKEFPSGKPCYVTRETQTFEERVKDFIYTTITYTSQKEEYQEVILDENQEPVLENGEPTFQTKTRTVLGNEIHRNQKNVSIEKYNQLEEMLEPNIPQGLSGYNKLQFKKALALQFLTINDEDLQGGFMDTNEWELDTE